jgi:starch phosphorylase
MAARLTSCVSLQPNPANNSFCALPLCSWRFLWRRSVVHHAEHTLATDRYNFDMGTAYQSVAYSVRDYLVESFRDTKAHYVKEDPKRVYYLSLEFLMGRSLLNSLMNLDLEKPYKEALDEIGFKLEDLVEEEKDAALGNGGLGRLAACFLDSMATLNLPAWGYGIRYEHGMFEQRFKDGNQVEYPDTWLTKGNPWEIQRIDIKYPVVFYGSETVMAVAYDVPIPGYAILFGFVFCILFFKNCHKISRRGGES